MRAFARSSLLAVVGLVADGVAGPVSAIDGDYHVNGAGARGANPHQGTARIVKTGESYAITWRIGSTTYAGTGVLTSNVLSIAFLTGGPTGKPGVAAYRVVNGRVGQGIWTYVGSAEVGTETMEPSDRS